VLRGEGTEEEEESLRQLPGLGAKTLQRIRSSVAQWSTVRASLAFCRGLGVLSEGQVAELVSMYSNETEQVLRSNLYVLLDLFPSLNFAPIDDAARTALGVAADAPERVQAALHHNLQRALSSGHCCVPQAYLLDAAARQLVLGDAFGLPRSTAAVKAALSEQVKSGAIVQEAPPPPSHAPEKPRTLMVTLARVHALESHIAKATRQRLAEVADDPVVVKSATVEALLEKYALSERQQQALQQCDLSRVMLLTGGPGTGKTYTVNAIVKRWLAEGKRVLLACPTARAANVLASYVGQPASTVHRLLEYNPREERFERCASNPLVTDCVVIDEVSMLDVFLAGALLNALPPKCSILMVGDDDQLPSVGPGAVLHDLLRCPRVPRVVLDVLFRQDPSGDIARNARCIQQGQFPAHLTRFSSVSALHSAVATTDELRRKPTGSFFVKAESESAAADAICDHILPWLQQAGYDLKSEVQVLSPMKKGAVGTHMLNARLQEILNPTRAKDRFSAAALPEGQASEPRVNDLMIQLVNDYDSEVFNGDIGTVKRVWTEGRTLRFTVVFDSRTKGVNDLVVDYTRSALNRDIAFAYALTVHKAQGGEYPVVVLPMVLQHSVMLYRNLLYTGLSRGKKLVVMVGSEDAVRMAVQNNARAQRATLLAERIFDRDFAPMVTRHM